MDPTDDILNLTSTWPGKKHQFKCAVTHDVDYSMTSPPADGMKVQILWSRNQGNRKISKMYHFYI